MKYSTHIEATTTYSDYIELRKRVPPAKLKNENHTNLINRTYKIHPKFLMELGLLLNSSRMAK